MPQKNYVLVNGLAITVHKKRGNRNMRLSISHDGTVRVSIPTWVPYIAGVEFAKSRQQWIFQHAAKQPSSHLTHGQAIGKAHHIFFESHIKSSKPTSRVSAGTILIKIPPELNSDSPEVQSLARKAAIRALRSQAEALLPHRLAMLAENYNFNYRDVSIKQLKSRWGSCDQRKSIVLNLFLMQLPWELIDYVLLHELVHTEIMQHGTPFWSRLEALSPDLKKCRTQIKSYRPVLHSSDFVPVA